MKKWILVITFLCGITLLAACNKTSSIQEKTEEKVETYEIETPYVNIEYPEKWKNQIRTKGIQDGIEFYGRVDKHNEEKLLFTLEFGKSDGYLLGTLNKIGVYIVDNDVQFDDSWTEEEIDEIYTMQEDVNVILQSLIEMDSFKLNKQ